MATIDVWPRLGFTVTMDDGVTVIGPSGENVTYNAEVRSKIAAGILLSYNPSPDEVVVETIANDGPAPRVLDVRSFGALCDGTTDDTAPVQAAIDAAYTLGSAVFFPPGTTRVGSIYYYPGTKLEGAGPGPSALTSKSIIKQTSADAGARMIDRASSVSGVISYLTIRDLKLQGVDGAGGVGLSLRGVTLSCIDNVYAASFRNSGDTGIGLELLNTTTAGCFGNTFSGVTVEDSDTGLLMDTVSGGTTASGYNRFHGLTIYQEKDCIRLQNSYGSGSIYNTFSGVLLQGNASGNKGIVCDGSGNTFAGVIIDNVTGNHVEYGTGASGNVIVGGSLDAARVVNNNTSGSRNILIGGSQLAGGLGQPYLMQGLSGSTQLALLCSGAGNGPEIYYGTATSSQHWRHLVQNGGASAYFQLNHYSAGAVARWLSTGDTQLFKTLQIAASTATPAGGSTGVRLLFGSSTDFGVYAGSGAPTVAAGKGSLYLRSDGSSTSTRLYVNTDGSTGWTAVTTAT